MTSLSVVNVGVQRGGRWILNGITLEVRRGEVLAIVGPNGSGKSTLLRTLAGLWRADQGNVLLKGRQVSELRRTEIAREITYVPQESQFEFDFTVKEIVLMGRYPHRGRFERETQEDRTAAEEALERADIAHLGERSVTRLSGGEKQRVLIARSLATRAHILLLDEPTANLDVDHSLDVLALCRSLAAEGRAVAIATHDLNSVYRFADEVALVDSGRLVAAGKPGEVLTRENLERTFHVTSEALTGANGTPLLLFHRINNERNT
jgi:iron complex transport system ATP-binding protein